jgi:flagellin
MDALNTNMHALVARNAMALHQRSLTTSMQQLSTGRRVNSVADDAAAMAISSKLGAQIKGLDMAVRNANDGISMLQTADSAAGTLTDVLNRMRELAIQAANDTYSSSDRSALQVEFSSLQDQLEQVLDNTEWNDYQVLKGDAGTSGSVKFQIGATGDDQASLTMNTLDSGSLASAQLAASVSISSRSAATNALSTIDDAIVQIDAARAEWGATINRLVHAADSAVNISQNSQFSRSTLIDTDYAQATANLARSMILEEAGAAMLTQANQQPYYVLTLLR